MKSSTTASAPMEIDDVYDCFSEASIDGCYLASYAIDLGEVFVAYTKICTVPPSDFWDCKPLAKVSGEGHSVQEALLRSRLKAHERIKLAGFTWRVPQ